jgi:hypothetical protein
MIIDLILKGTTVYKIFNSSKTVHTG